MPKAAASSPASKGPVNHWETTTGEGPQGTQLCDPGTCWVWVVRCMPQNLSSQQAQQERRAGLGLIFQADVPRRNCQGIVGRGHSGGDPVMTVSAGSCGARVILSAIPGGVPFLLGVCMALPVATGTGHEEGTSQGVCPQGCASRAWGPRNGPAIVAAGKPSGEQSPFPSSVKRSLILCQHHMLSPSKPQRQGPGTCSHEGVGCEWCLRTRPPCLGGQNK